MKLNIGIRLLTLMTLTVSSLACTPGTLNVAAPNVPVTGDHGQCTNPFYPVVKGATWNYASTGNPAGTFNYTDTITDSRPDGFTLTSQFINLTRKQEWSCKPEGLQALQLGSGSAALSTTDLSTDFKTVTVNGVTLPANIKTGEKWNYELNSKGSATLQNGQTSESTNSVKMNAEAIGAESVTVPAGTFNAIKVQVDSTLNVNATLQGTTIPFTITSKTTRWYAPGVGWIKTVESSDFGGTPTTSTTELQSYKIP